MWRGKKKQLPTECPCGCAEIWQRYAENPKLRCPRCGAVTGIPAHLGIGCFRCSMRYSPVTRRRYVNGQTKGGANED